MSLNQKQDILSNWIKESQVKCAGWLKNKKHKQKNQSINIYHFHYLLEWSLWEPHHKE